MKYVGSKARHAKTLATILEAARMPDQPYAEPFMGGANMLVAMSGTRSGNDMQPYVVALLSAVRDGWAPPMNVSENEYKRVRQHQGTEPPHYVGFVGFCCSFSGKWWGGYARGKSNRGADRNYAAEAARHLLKQAPLLSGATFYCGDYRDMPLEPKSLIYCDPPYAGTQGYSASMAHNEFWPWAESLVRDGHTVFVSEYSAPENWTCVWEKVVLNTLDLNTGAKQGVERLFTLKEPQ